MTHKFYFVFYTFLLLGGHLFICSQERRSVTAEATLTFSDDIPYTRARMQTILQAQTDIIAAHFGTCIDDENQQFINDHCDDYADATNSFFSFNTCDVQGEWIETKGDTLCEFSPTQKGTYLCHVVMNGIIKRLRSTSRPIAWGLLDNGTDPELNGVKNFTFYHKDRLFLTFRSPVRGFLLFYLIDLEDQLKCYRLLPYQGHHIGSYPIEANHTYVFFDPPTAEPFAEDYVQYVRMLTNERVNYNQFYLVFSTNPISRPTDEQSAEIVEGLEMPASLDFESFQQWLSQCRVKDPKMVVKKIVVAIEP